MLRVLQILSQSLWTVYKYTRVCIFTMAMSFRCVITAQPSCMVSSISIATSNVQ